MWYARARSRFPSFGRGNSVGFIADDFEWDRQHDTLLILT
ncbi:hypothetical protein HMPREF2533_01318 [Bacteroides fragilis]|nr:hypothetical protein HMPREF2530_01318 [Bacteroides fragilis]KXU48208.1 hypothetical protein HMPREF2533_01318 [Bacteroides fragilis]